MIERTTTNEKECYILFAHKGSPRQQRAIQCSYEHNKLFAHDDTLSMFLKLKCISFFSREVNEIKHTLLRVCKMIKYDVILKYIIWITMII